MRREKALALLLVIFMMLLFSLFAMVLTSVFANRTEIAKGFYRSGQVFYINDIGMERAKQKLYQDWNWRPSQPPGYLEETLTIGELNCYYRIYVQESIIEVGSLEIEVESGIQ